MQFLFWRRKGDSNPRYSYPYDSLANCWFQPLTHLSVSRFIKHHPFLLMHFAAVVQSAFFVEHCLMLYFRCTTVDLSELSLSSQKRVQRYAFFLNCANQSCRFRYFFCFFLDISYFCSTFAADFDLLTLNL